MRSGEETGELQVEAARLAARVATFNGTAMTPRHVREIMQIVKDHRAYCRLDGLDFPKMVAVVIPEAGTVDLYRADLDDEGIRAVILRTAHGTPGVTPQMVAEAIMRAWPRYRPDLDDPRLRGTVVGS